MVGNSFQYVKDSPGCWLIQSQKLLSFYSFVRWLSSYMGL